MIAYNESALPEQLPELCIVAHGLGQDSATMTEKMIRDPLFRARYGGKHIIFVTADTGDEHPDTDRYRIGVVEPRLRDAGFQYEFLSGDRGFHTLGWSQGLHGQWERNNTIGAASFPPSCSHSLKIAPQYMWLEAYIEEHYGYARGDKRGLKDFVKRYGKVRVLIGFTRGEEKRAAGAEDDLQTAFVFKDLKEKKKQKTTPVWMKECIERRYPLMEIGYYRADCQRYLAEVDAFTPFPSQCCSCPYKSKIDILWTARRLPERWKKWVAAERRKLDHWEGRRDKNGVPIANHGVKGLGSTLALVLVEAERQYGHMSDAELDAYRFTHGHFIPSCH